MGAGPQLWQPGTVTVTEWVVMGTTVTTAGADCEAQGDLVHGGAGMVKVPVISGQLAVSVTVGLAVSPGHHVVSEVMVSVVTWPTGQLVTVGAHDVMV